MRYAVAAILLGLMGCMTPYKIAIEAAEQALLRNDLAAAARHYLTACRIDPDETKICEKAKNLTTEVVQKAVEDASLALGKGDVDFCLDVLAPARLISTDTRLFQIAENAGDALAERCAGPDDDMIAKTAEVRCLESRHRKVATTKFTQHVRDRRGDAAALMLARVKTSEAKQPALANVLRAVAMCTAKESVRKEERDLGEKRLLDAVSIAFNLRVKAQGLGDATDVLQSACSAVESRKAARCVKSARDGAIVLNVEANVSELNHTVQEDHRSVRYVAGIDRVPNPRFKEARHKVRRLEDEVRESKRKRDSAQSRCNSAPQTSRETECRYARDADSDLRSAESDLRSAESTLSNTPELIDQERWENYNYVARVHRYWVDYTLRLAREGAEPQAATGRLEYGGEDRTGFSPANISASVSAPPTFRDFANDLYPREASLIRGSVADTMSEIAKRTEDGCGADNDAFFWSWLDCHLRAALYRDGNMLSPFWRALEPKMPQLAREAPEYPCE